MVDRSGRDPDGKPVADLPHAADVLDSAFATDVGVDNDPIEADGGFVWYDVAGITPARDRTLDEVKDEVEQRWRDDEIASRLKAKAADMLDKLKGGTALDALAAANGLKVETATDLKRGGTTPQLSPRDDRRGVPDRQGRVRQRRKAIRRRNGSCSASPTSRRRRSTRLGRHQADRAQRCSSHMPTTHRPIYRLARKQSRHHHQPAALLAQALGQQLGQQRAGHQLNADRAFGAVVRGTLCGRRSRKSYGRRWSPIWKRRSRLF